MWGHVSGRSEVSCVTTVSPKLMMEEQYAGVCMGGGCLLVLRYSSSTAFVLC